MDKMTGYITISGHSVSGSISIGSGSNVPTYSGEYIVTPAAETQTLSTAGYKLIDNITINSIPSNYGLITWDGSVLTVS